MKLELLLFALLITFTVYSQEAETSSVMPQPHLYKKGSKEHSFRITPNTMFSIDIQGPINTRVHEAYTRFVTKTKRKTGQQLASNEQKKSAPNVIVRYKNTAKLITGEDESYSLTIDEKGIQIVSSTDLGALHAFETSYQLLEVDSEGYFFPAVYIEDKPRFAWRGLMIDVCRHFIPKESIKKQLDGMAMLKLNILHLHLSDDQGFRVECKAFPKLHELGSNASYFTHEDIKELVKYAYDRGIRIIPEFDVPGHVTSWLVGYPELGSEENKTYSIEQHFGVFDPSLDPSKESTYKFLKTFFKEMSTLFPDPVVHIGGDENNGKQWLKNKRIVEFMEQKKIKNTHELQTYFNIRLSEILTDLNKKIIGWDEIADNKLPKDIIVQSWRDKESLWKSAKQGYKSILSHGYYLDMAYNSSTYYSNDPLPNSCPLDSIEMKNILGGEACMWSELVDETTIDSRIWPSAAAISERLWSKPSVSDESSMYDRLEKIQYELEFIGLNPDTYSKKLAQSLSASDSIDAVLTLLSVLEPLKGYSRHKAKKASTNLPLTRIPDLAKPNQFTVLHFNKLVKEYCANPSHELRKTLTEILIQWSDNHYKYIRIAHIPIFKEGIELSKNLSQLAEIGLNAIDQDVHHSHEWKQHVKEIITQSKKPIAECEIAIISSIETLVNFTKN